MPGAIFDWPATFGLATTFVLSLVCGFAGVACVFKLALDVLVVAAGESLNQSSEGEDGPFWTWPRDRIKIAAQMAALVIGAAVFMALSYLLAVRIFGHG